MAKIEDSYLSGANIDFIEGLFARFLEDPSSVDPSWRDVFNNYERRGRPLFSNGKSAAAQLPTLAVAPRPGSAEIMGLQARVDQAIYAFRIRGHLLAQIDPLGRPRPPLEHIADLGMVNPNFFSEEEQEQWVDSNGVFAEKQVRLRDLLGRLRRTYCGQVGVEFMNVQDSNRRRWLLKTMEYSENRMDPTLEEQRRILTKLSYAVTFESFLHTKYVGAKRFSLDGAETLVPMIDFFLEDGGTSGLEEVVMGMAHRGRLNVLANVLGKSPGQIFSEFEGPADPRAYLNRGDVKYHLGFSSDHLTQQGQKIHLSLAFNPSHLEAVDPVVEGRVRAKQDRIQDESRTKGVALLIHGDASFAGQGVVAETLNLAELPGYTTGGTVHVIINNQIGFTTEPNQLYSSRYCTAVAQMLDIPIFHVNGDDPEACVHVMRLATHFRQTFHSDVVVDLVCFRRYGHNEGDEPAFTQPKMYELIRSHPTVRQLYAEQLARQGRISAEEAEAIQQRCLEEFRQAYAEARKESQLREPSYLEGLWKNVRGGPSSSVPEVDTAVDQEHLAELLTKLSQVPAGFTLHPKIARVLETRAAMAQGKQPLDWAAAEALAYATLLTEGYSVRLTGQDTERGTFSHRHAVLHDVKTGACYYPFQNLSPVQADCTILNSPLSEVGCLGFEFGYSLDYPDALVAWEAQYGDFANSAQVIIDQFIAAAEDKWNRLSGIVLLLPHGYEGQGPEHSSARLERFLALCAEDNMQVCYPTTAAQIFHLLRRQVIRPWRKPLILMWPKSMLRRPEVSSAFDQLSQGKFHRLIADPAETDGVDRLLLCTGKVYYDLAAGWQSKPDPGIQIARLEQLYPLPTDELRGLLASMPKLKEIIWVQEEPRNLGAWKYMSLRLQDLASAMRPREPIRVGFVGRVETASPATGFYQAHVIEQKLIVDEALSRGGKHGH
jgi:2-oxoglutarate dehydrogenase E1 component